MFSFRNQANYWKNGSTQSESIPFATLPRKPFQRSQVGSSNVERIRHEIKSQTAAPLSFGDYASNSCSQNFQETPSSQLNGTWLSSSSASNDNHGKLAATNYLANRELEKEIKKFNENKEKQLETIRKRDPVKYSSVKTMNQIFYNSNKSFNSHMRSKVNDIQKRKIYQQSIYSPDRTSKAKPF